MPQVELTDRFCQSAKAGDSRKVDYFDVTVKGLCLRVSSGGAKAFYLVYTKPADGKRAWMKLGRYPDLSLAKAREKAREARAEVGEGEDPVAQKRAAEASQTVADLVDNYLARAVSKKRSVEEIARRLRKNVSGRDAQGKEIEGASKGCVGYVKLSDLHRRDLTKCIDAVVDRGAKVEANRIFEDLRAMVRWARGRGDLDQNIMEGMRRPTEVVERDRYLTAAEIKTVWDALPAADMRESTRRIVRLCLITGQRVGEVAGMTMSEVSDNQMIWTIPAERSKNGREHKVPLSNMALAIIREQLEDVRALSERKNRPVPSCIFPGPGARAAVTPAAVAKAIKRQEVVSSGKPTVLGVAPWTPHDLRRTAATHMEETGVSPFIIGHVLNHLSATRAGITSRVYARYSYDAEKRDALEVWATRLEGIISGGAAVVPLARTKM